MSGLSSSIVDVSARQILDSRGRPTVEADVTLADGSVGRACVPSGASTGLYEAREMRDLDKTLYEGFGVLAAVGHVKTEIRLCLLGMDALDQAAIDQRMIEADGTPNFHGLGANGVLAVSLAVARAAAVKRNLPLYTYISILAGDTPMSLPLPMTNILSGGAHAGRSMDLQDFLAVPIGASSYSEALHMVARLRNAAAALMRKDGLSVLLADEGGLSPGFARAEDALALMVRSTEAAGLRPGVDVAIALDVAASELFQDGRYSLPGEGRQLSGSEMISFLADLVRRYPIISIEDALDQDDWENWQTLTNNLEDLQIVGDDLFVTQSDRIARGIKYGVANAVLIKVNQNGTLTGTLKAIAVARSDGYATIVSARSGETEDSFIADLAVGTGAGQIKIGSIRNSERLSKYNQLLRIEEKAGLPFAGTSRIAGANWKRGV